MPASNIASAAFVTEAIPAPTWASAITLPQGTRNSAYSYNVAQHASGEGTLTYSTVTALPAGLTLSAAGVLAGTPTTITGGLVIVFTVTNEGGSANSNGLLVVVEEGLAPKLTHQYQDLVVRENGIVNIDLGNSKWSSNAGAMTFAATGTWPEGLTFGTDGVLTGTTGALGSYGPFVVTATNSIGSSQGNSFSLRVISAITTGALNDAKMAAIEAQLGYRTSMPDMTLAWLHLYGATSDNVADAWMEMLAVQLGGSSDNAE